MPKFNIDKFAKSPEAATLIEKKIKEAVLFGYIKALTGREVDGRLMCRNDAVRQFFEDGGINEDFQSLESSYVLGNRIETKHNREK